MEPGFGPITTLPPLGILPPKGEVLAPPNVAEDPASTDPPIAEDPGADGPLPKPVPPAPVGVAAGAGATLIPPGPPTPAPGAVDPGTVGADKFMLVVGVVGVEGIAGPPGGLLPGIGLLIVGVEGSAAGIPAFPGGVDDGAAGFILLTSFVTGVGFGVGVCGGWAGG